MAMSPIRCVIFDCDGTLVDSETLCCQALVRVFARFNVDVPLEKVIAQFKGGKLADILDDARTLFGLKVSLDVLEPIYRSEVNKLFYRHLKAMSGAVALLDFLTKMGIEYCVVSNGPKEKIEYSLQLTGLLERFHGRIFSAFDANSWKPDPDLVMYSAFNMGFLPEECIYVDDTAKGVKAGLSAGIRTYYLANGFQPNQIQDARVTKIEHLEELIALVADTNKISDKQY
ncbi:6-phosphogluconate phosphatase [Vibrio navarrensis]|uniref:6-phosphogluconate phosphatase n=1 Tax=Vibrio navarrensis TaxID=29495 RepID=UPI00155958FC|nr:6-phosphogluconate phosphatase [Vibrio navarrensis]